MAGLYITKFREADGQPEEIAFDAPMPRERVQVDVKAMSARGLWAADVRDRQGDVVPPGVFDLSAHEANPTILLDHGKWGPFPVGRARTDEGLYTVEVAQDGADAWQWTRFSESQRLAEELFRLLEEDMIRGNSPGFRPIAWDDLPDDEENGYRGGYQKGEWKPAGKLIRKAELCEISWCSIPVNQEAARAAVCKSWGGKPLSPVFVQAFQPWLPPRKPPTVTGGWASDKLDFSRDKLNLSDGQTHLSPSDKLDPAGLAAKAWSFLDGMDTEPPLSLAQKAWLYTESWDAEGKARAVGETWQGNSGRWFTKREDGRVVPTKNPGGEAGKPKPQTRQEYAAWQEGQKERHQGPAIPKQDSGKVRERMLAAAKGEPMEGDTPSALATALRGLTVAEIASLKKELGLKASGPKAEYARKVAERAVMLAKASAQEKPAAPQEEAVKPAEGEKPSGEKPAAKSGPPTDPLAIGRDGLRGAWEAMRDELAAHDPKLSPNRAGELAAARLRQQMGNKLADIEGRTRSGDITPEEERFYDEAYVNGWEFGRELEMMSGSRTMAADADDPYVNRPLDAGPLEDRATPQRERGESLRANAAEVDARRAKAAKDKAETNKKGREEFEQKQRETTAREILRARVARSVEAGKTVPDADMAKAGFTGTDAQGREWANGELVAAKEEAKGEEAATPAAAAPAPAKPLDTGKAAKHLHVAPRTVSKWVDNGQLPATRDAATGNRLVAPGDLVAFMNDHGLAVPPELAGVEPSPDYLEKVKKAKADVAAKASEKPPPAPTAATADRDRIEARLRADSLSKPAATAATAAPEPKAAPEAGVDEPPELADYLNDEWAKIPKKDRKKLDMDAWDAEKTREWEQKHGQKPAAGTIDGKPVSGSLGQVAQEIHSAGERKQAAAPATPAAAPVKDRMAALKADIAAGKVSPAEARQRLEEIKSGQGQARGQKSASYGTDASWLAAKAWDWLDSPQPAATSSAALDAWAWLDRTPT
jgi:hypothetical protein